MLVTDNMDVQSYNNVSIVLDYEQDASGNSPGCYVLTEDDAKHNLNSSSESQSEIVIQDGFDVQSSSTKDVIIDFDLRKSIKGENEMQDESDYSFATASEMESTLRVVVESNAGHIAGETTNESSAEGKMVVYAYRKGDFNMVTETQGQGTSNIMFANAVTSTEVNSDGSYHLSFLEEGEYEIYMVNYSDNNGNGHMEFNSMMSVTSNTSGLLLDGMMVDAGTTISVDILITGFIGGV
ncbi:MAG: DUF4382 domain-containing protein [Bacteroidales bacterium]|nr:DUF4382 domain-containing protein [Bacteroidales bacterium]